MSEKGRKLHSTSRLCVIKQLLMEHLIAHVIPEKIFTIVKLPGQLRPW